MLKALLLEEDAFINLDEEVLVELRISDDIYLDWITGIVESLGLEICSNPTATAQLGNVDAYLDLLEFVVSEVLLLGPYVLVAPSRKKR